MAVVDEISPPEYGEDRFVLKLSQDTPNPRAFSPVVVEIDYSAADPEGLVLPLELTITGPSGTRSYERRVFPAFAPASIAFKPREGGAYLVRMTEQNHNRWFGSLPLDVEGDPLRQEFPT